MRRFISSVKLMSVITLCVIDQQVQSRNTVKSPIFGSAVSEGLHIAPESFLKDIKNDDPESALELQHMVSWCSEEGAFTTKGMKPGGDKISCAEGKGNKSHNDVWFKFQATSISIELSAIPFGKDQISKHSLALHDQDLVELVCGASVKDDSPAKIASSELIAGEWYFIRVDNEDKSEGRFTLCSSTQISNDFQAGALEIPHTSQWCSSPGTYSLTGMSPAGALIICDKEKQPIKDVWFTFQATQSTIELKVLPSGELGITKHRAALYDMANNQITCGTQADKGGPVKLASSDLIPGEWYYIRIDSDDKKKGDFELCVSTLISHDFQEGAIQLAHELEFCTDNGAYTTIGMTPQGEAMDCGKEKKAQNDVWFSFEATTASIEFFVYPYREEGINEFAIGLYNEEGDQLICAVQLDKDAPAKIADESLTIGAQYFIRIDNDKDQQGNFDICLQNKLGYDFQGGAKELIHQSDWYAPSGQLSTLGMTPEGEKIACAKEKETQNDVWFTFLASTNELELEVIPDGDPAIDKMVAGLYDAQLDEVSCEKQPGKKQKIKIVNNALVSGQRYYVRIDNEEDKAGDFILRLRNEFSYDLSAGAMEIPHASDWCSPDAVFSTLEMTPERNAISCAKEKEPQNDVWFTFQATTEIMQLELVPMGDIPIVELSAALYTDSFDELACVSFHEETALIKMAYGALKVGEWYIMRIDNGKDGQGDFNLCLRNEINYDFSAGAERVPHTDTWCSEETAYSTFNMTPDAKKLSCTEEKESQSDVWFIFQASKETLEVEIIPVGDQPIGGVVTGLYDAELNELECVKILEGASNTNFSRSSLVLGSWYYIRVDNSKGAQGDFQLCVRGGEVIPEPPAGLLVSYDPLSAFNSLSWTDQAGNEQGFIVERNINGGSFEYLDSIPMNLVSYQDANINQGISYAYRVSAQNYTGASPFSNEDFTIVQTIDQLDPVALGYDVVLYVNQLGNDTFAKVNNPSKPWSTPHVASVTAHALNQTESQRYLIYVQKGTYNDFWVTMPGIDIFFEDDAVVWYNTEIETGRSIISDWRGGVGDYNVLGKGRFYVTTVHGADDRDAINFRYNSSLEISCREFNSLQVWNQFQSDIEINDAIIRLPQSWNSGINSTITYNNCEFKTGYLKMVAGGKGSREIFNKCTFQLLNITEVDQAMTVVDHNGDPLFSMEMLQVEFKLNTAELSHQEIANLSYVNHNDPISMVASFAVHGPQNPWRGWASKSFDFSYLLSEPTFVVNRPNGIAVKVIWNENDPSKDYSDTGIIIENGQAIGAAATNPIFLVANKREATSGDIPINIINTTYNGFTDRISKETFTPMLTKGGSEGIVPDDIEVAVLTGMYKELNGEQWLSKDQWLNGIASLNMAVWEGISVLGGDVVSLELANNALKGVIPVDLLNLSELKLLDLGSNELAEEIPVSLARLENLKVLKLNDNQLQGYMDLEFSVMPHIREMDLRNNDLVSIPDFSFNPQQDKSLISLFAEENKLEFYYIENNLNADGTDLLGTFAYMPQKEYGEPRIVGFIQGRELKLTVNMLGRSNHYQWQVSKDNGQSWGNVGIDDPELSIPNVQKANEGNYRVVITNDRANEPGDEIISAIKTVRIEKEPVVINRPID